MMTKEILAALLFLMIAALPAQAKEEASVHLIPLDDDFPAERLAAPGVEIQTNQKPVGKNGPLPMRTLRHIKSELQLELPGTWDALEEDMFFGRVEFQGDEALRKHYGSTFSSRQLSELRQALRRARAEAIRKGEKQ